MRDTTRQMTVDAFFDWATLPANRERHFELVEGEPRESEMVSITHLRIQHWLDVEIGIWLRVHRMGELFVEMVCYIPPNRINTRRPDLGFVSSERMASLDASGRIPFMPDLAIEVNSPSNLRQDEESLPDKAAFYLKHGTRLVWAIYPETETVEVYTPGGDAPDVRTLGADDTLDGGDVLPGLHIAVRDLFAAGRGEG